MTKVNCSPSNCVRVKMPCTCIHYNDYTPQNDLKTQQSMDCHMPNDPSTVQIKYIQDLVVLD